MTRLCGELLEKLGVEYKNVKVGEMEYVKFKFEDFDKALEELKDYVSWLFAYGKGTWI